MLALVEAVERSKHRLQRGSLDLQLLRHGQLALFRVCLSFRTALALGLPPAIALVETGEPQPRLEEEAPDRLQLVLSLALPPSRHRHARAPPAHITVRPHQHAPV